MFNTFNRVLCTFYIEVTVLSNVWERGMVLDLKSRSVETIKLSHKMAAIQGTACHMT